jgi:asparagine synthase (glutamine-hydrolysing)
VEHKLGNLEREIKRIDENTKRKKKSYSEYDDGKNLLRKAMESYIPKRILERQKQGFSAPDENWYRGENALYIKELLLDPSSLSRKYINPDYVKQIVHEHLYENKNHRLLIWSFMNFEWWCKIFLK